MAKNLEIKLYVNSFDPILQALKQIDASYEGILSQKDIYYKVRNYLLKLRIEGDSLQLIKYKRNESGGDRFSDYDILTLSGEDPEFFLKDIFEIEAIVDKKRELYLYKNTRIHLDTVKDLGTFIELETIVTTSEEDARERFNFLLEKLNLDFERQLRKSYRDMKLLRKNEFYHYNE